MLERRPITGAARSKAWTVFARSNTEIVGSNPTQVMDVSVCLFCVCVVLRIGRGLAIGWSPVQGVLQPVYRIKKLKSGKGPTKGCRATDSLSDSRRGFRLEIGFVDHLHGVTTNNYNIISNFHTLQMTTAHAKSFQPAFTSRFPATDLNNGDPSTAPTKSQTPVQLTAFFTTDCYNWARCSKPSRL
jgi:hypothetical protein